MTSLLSNSLKRNWGYPIKKWAAAAALLFTFTYLFISGMTLPAQRAFIMTGFVLLGVLCDRIVLTMRNVALAALTILLILPESLLMPSFQMSFAAVIALVSGYETFRPLLIKWQIQKEGKIRKFSFYLLGISFSTVLATLATTPYIIFTFNRLTVHAIPANLIAIPLLSFCIMPLLVLFFLFNVMGCEKGIAFVLKMMISWIIKMATEISRWPGSVIFIRAMSPTALGWYTLGALWLVLWQKSWRYAGFGGLCLCLGLMIFNHPPDLFILAERKFFAWTGQDQILWVNSFQSGRFARDTWMKRMALYKYKKMENYISSEKTQEIIVLPQGYRFSNVNGQLEINEDKGNYYQDWSIKLTHSFSHGSIDLISLLEKGGHLIWLTSTGLVVKTVADEIGNRPWSLKRSFLNK